MMIPIKIGKEDYRFTSDANNFMLAKSYKDKKTGRTRWQPFKYWSTLESAIESLLQMKLRACNVRTLTGLQRELKKVSKELRGVYHSNLTS